MSKPLACAAAILLVAGCASKVAPDPFTELFAAADPGSLSGSYAFPGVRLETSGEGPEVEALEAAVSELAATCEAVDVMWLDCGESPCALYVWGVDVVAPAWSELACGGGALQGVYIGHYSVGAEDYMVEAGVYAVALDETPDAGLETLQARARHDLYDHVLAEAAAAHGIAWPAPSR